MDQQTPFFQFDTVEVEPAAFVVRQAGRRVNLEPKATRVLIHLLRHRDRAVTKDELVATVWEGTAVTDNAITRVIAQLRRELGDDPRTPKYIETIPTLGYRFIAEVREVAPSSAPAAMESPPTSRKPLVAGAALLAILTGAGWWAIQQKSQSGTAGPVSAEATQLTTTDGVDAKPSFAPDGRSFVFCSNKTGRFELYRRELAGGAPAVQLTNGVQQAIQPSWSPDGRWIAYHSPAQRGLWVIPSAGGPPRRLTQFGSAPAWSPDSRSLAFVSAEPFSLGPFDSGGAGTLWTVELDGSALRQIAMGPIRGWPSTPSWSPEGKRIAFVALSPRSAVYVLDVATSALTLLVQTGVHILRKEGTLVSRMWDPVFSPDGASIYFTAAGGKGVHTIFRVPARGGTPEPVFDSPTGTPNGLTIAPDGSRILFALLRNESSLWSVNGVNEKGSIRPVFREQVQRTLLPSYSPDGRWLVFAVEAQGRNRDLWIRPAEGGEAIPLTDEPGPKEGGLVWTPGGELLYNYVSRGDDSHVEFRAYDPKTRRSRKIHERGTARMIRPLLMPNARDLLATCSTPVNICLAPVTSETLRQISFEREPASFALPDRSGQWIAYQARRGDTDQIVLMRPDGSEVKQLTNEPGTWHWSGSFTSDGRRVAYAAFRQGVWNLWWIDRHTGERKQLTHETGFGPFVRSPAWRPGTDEIAYEWFQARGNVFSLNLR